MCFWLALLFHQEAPKSEFCWSYLLLAVILLLHFTLLLDKLIQWHSPILKRALEEAIREKNNNWEDELCVCCRYSDMLFLYTVCYILKFTCNTVSRANQVIPFAVGLVEQSLLFVSAPRPYTHPHHHKPCFTPFPLSLRPSQHLRFLLLLHYWTEQVVVPTIASPKWGIAAWPGSAQHGDRAAPG